MLKNVKQRERKMKREEERERRKGMEWREMNKELYEREKGRREEGAEENRRCF